MKQITLIITLILFTGGCVQTNSPNSITHEGSVPPLKVGISTNYPPIAYKENSKITGLEADFAKGLADYTGRQLKLIHIRWKDQIPALLSGKTDIIMSGMTITNSRKYRISFTTPYLISGQISLIRRTDRRKFGSGAADLLSPTVKVGTIEGTTGDYFIQDINKVNKLRSQFTNSTEAVKALLSGSLDAFVYDLPGILYLASQHNDDGLIPVTVPLTKEYLAWGVRPDDQKLLNEANSYLASLADNGLLTKKIQRWIPYYKP
ncbi:MAG: transporter substrate-binding domain-containing protein [Deltaproteobacteria bacterium]|nr:transporter substrate-binding domain-containing protein [Deltaproteobacteria bacterium]MBW2659214.1 transporter substrate-binding domain-containing protein [Deltaproteobacteria bacterium]